MDQAPDEGDGWWMPSLAVFAEQIGARGVFVTGHTVEIVEPHLPEIVDHLPIGKAEGADL